MKERHVASDPTCGQALGADRNDIKPPVVGSAETSKVILPIDGRRADIERRHGRSGRRIQVPSCTEPSQKGPHVSSVSRYRHPATYLSIGILAL
jgi:hypothetical protein